MEAPPDSHLELTHLQAEQVLAASRSFSRRTAQTWDGFHPRHYALLTMEQAEVIVALVTFMERVGLTPSCTQAVMAKLIPKHKAESPDKLCMRSIGLMPSLYRLWARMRQSVARDWESRNKTPLLAHQSGRSIMEVVYVQSLKAEAAQLQDEVLHTRAFLWDLANFYEFLNRRRLWERAESTGFPLAVAALALNQYSAKRFLGLETIAMDCFYPERGIAA